MKIEDGKGSGLYAQVDTQYRLSTFAVIEEEDKHNNKEGHVWSITNSTTAVGVNDYVFYIKNNGTFPLYFTDIRVFVGATSTIYIDKVSGTPSYTAGSILTPVNRNLGSSSTMDITTYEDTNITGLTNEGTIFFQQCDTANRHYHLKTSSTIILPQGQSLAIRTSAATSVQATTSWTHGNQL